ncbi:MAG: 6-carboxytetrahydropterin synthase QueD [Lachnospiraceae bacterium]|nr:6-carboxytetrahydropterin synthase QueD [Lachnospiraceae bacterium]
MYTIQTEQHFDAAHFLAGYDGKCSNLHGHRWRVSAQIGSETLKSDGQLRGMVADFGDVKRDLKELTEYFDHTFIYESGSLKEETIRALCGEEFALVEVPFRPTAECFAKYFYDRLKEKGYAVCRVEVYETPDNCAAYTGEC